MEHFFLTFVKRVYGNPVFNSTTRVLWKMMEFAEYNTGIVYMTTQRKRELMEDCKVSTASYNRAISDLVECGVLYRDKGAYTVNCRMFWKGDAKTRAALIKELTGPNTCKS